MYWKYIYIGPEMAQQVKVLRAKSNKLCSIPGPHGETDSLENALCAMVCTYPPPQTINVKIENKVHKVFWKMGNSS